MPDLISTLVMCRKAAGSDVHSGALCPKIEARWRRANSRVEPVAGGRLLIASSSSCSFQPLRRHNPLMSAAVQLRPVIAPSAVPSSSMPGTSAVDPAGKSGTWNGGAAVGGSTRSRVTAGRPGTGRTVTTVANLGEPSAGTISTGSPGATAESAVTSTRGEFAVRRAGCARSGCSEFHSVRARIVSRVSKSCGCRPPSGMLCTCRPALNTVRTGGVCGKSSTVKDRTVDAASPGRGR